MIWRSNGDVPNRIYFEVYFLTPEAWDPTPSWICCPKISAKTWHPASCLRKGSLAAVQSRKTTVFLHLGAVFSPFFFKEALWKRVTPGSQNSQLQEFHLSLPFYHVLILQKYHFHHQLQGIVVQTYLLHQRFGSQQRPQTTGWLPPCWTNGQIEAMEAPRWRHLWRDGVRPEVEEGTKKTLATVDGINPATPLDWYFIPLFTGFFYIPGGCLGFLFINSIIRDV